MKHGSSFAPHGSTYSNRGVRRCLIAGAAWAALTTDPAEATAQFPVAFQTAYYTMERAGIECRTQDPPMVWDWAALLNTDSQNTYTVWCPLDSPSQGGPTHVDVYVSQGWANRLSCTYAALGTAGTTDTGWWYPATSVNNNPGNQTDSVAFSIPQIGPFYGNEVECSIPAGQEVMAYDERLFDVMIDRTW
jgi:hypothetical protein